MTQETDRKIYSRKQIDRGIYERIGKNGERKIQVIVRLGRGKPQSKTFTSLTKARMWQEQIKTAIRDGKDFPSSEAKKHTLGKLIDRYVAEVLPKKPKSFKKQRAQLLWWKNEIGYVLLSDLTTPFLVEQRSKLEMGKTRTGTLRTGATISRYLAALSHALKIAIREWGWLSDSPMRNVTRPKESRGRVRFLSDDERSSLLQACKESSNEYLYVVVVLALSTGMRKSEMLNLNWADVDFERNCIILHETKNGERRCVPLTNLAHQLLKEMDKIRRIDTTLIFPSLEDKYKPIDLRFSWEKALKISGVTSFRFHDLRHSAASYLAMNGASVTEIAEILGHKTLAMVKRYSHLSKSHTIGVVSRMNDKIFG